MSSTLKTATFIIALLIVAFIQPLIGLLSLTIGHNVGRLVGSPDLWPYIATGINVNLMLLIFAVLKNAINLLFQQKHYHRDKIWMGFNLDRFTFADQSPYYIVPFLVYILPIFRDFPFDRLFLLQIGSLLFTLVLFNLLLRLSQDSMKIYFLHHGILIRGFDLRLDRPLSSYFHNSSGFYPYEKLRSYTLAQEQCTIHLPSTSGKITFSIAQEEQQSLIGLFEMQGIPPELLDDHN